MQQSLSAVYLHAVFSTKDRRPFLRDLTLRSSLHAHLEEVSKNLTCAPLRVGGVEDHVHILARVSRTITQADWVKELKRASNVWIKGPLSQLTGNGAREFGWEGGYACFSVSVSNLEAVESYILRQAEHHRKVSFQDELRAMLRKHGETWDEKYLWN